MADTDETRIEIEIHRRPGSVDAERLVRELRPLLKQLLGPSRTGMTRNLLPPPPFIPASEPSRRHTGAMSISQLSANEYIAAAATFITGLLVGVLLRL